MTTLNAALPPPAALPLEHYTDADAIRTLLQHQLPGFGGSGWRIESVAVSKVRRNTSISRNPCPMTLCYDLAVHDAATGRSGTQAYFAKVFRPGLAAAAYLAQDRGAFVAPAFGEPLVHLGAAGLVLWALPNDPVLTQLPALLDPQRAAGVLPWAALGIAQAQAAPVQVELLRYEPAQRATLRYTVAPAGGGAARVVYAKTFRDERARDIHERFEHFAQRARHDADAPLVAEPLAHHAATRSVWQAPAFGTPLVAWLGGPGGAVGPGGAGAVALLARVARALAQLHAAPLVLSAHALTRTAAHWVGESRRRARKVGRAAPHMVARVAAVANAIDAHAARQTARLPGLIHGDFHPDQVWVHEGRPVLFDFDEFTLGDPMEDVAEFLVKLEQVAPSGALASAWADAFVAAYAACAPERFDRASLDWHLAVQSLLQASRAFVYQQPGWPRELERRLAASTLRAARLTPEPLP